MSSKKKTTKKKAPDKPKKYAALTGSKQKRWWLPRSIAKTVAIWEDVAVDSLVAVTFNDKGGVNKPTASRSRKDVVWFFNSGKKKRVLEPAPWPFTEPEKKLKVPAGGMVGPFHLKPGSGKVTVTCYAPDTPFDPHPPGEPQFSVDD